MPDTNTKNEKLGEQIEALTTRANELVSGLGDAPSPDEVKAVQEEMNSLQSTVQPLIEERERRLTDESVKALTGRVEQLGEVVSELRTGLRMPDFAELGSKSGDDGLYQDGARSLFKDIALASKGGKAGQEAIERLEGAIGAKAFTEGDETQGGYLVEPQRLGSLPPKERAETLPGIFPTIRVKSDSIEFVSQTGGLVAGWAAELAEKPEGGSIAFSTLQASIFTAAGLAVASNQLLEDSSIDQFLIRDLRKRVNRVKEAAILTGTGTGQPRGILNTAGIQHHTYDDATPSVAELLVAIAESIGKVLDNHLSEPTHIVMRPQTWTRIITSADAQGKFTFGPGQSDPGDRTAADPFPRRTLFGYPVILSGLLPTNLASDGTATGDQTRVLVLDASEQLQLVRNDLAVDKSEHVFFTSNQTVFRAEQRVGFTAARYPKSIVSIEGTGLAASSGF